MKKLPKVLMIFLGFYTVSCEKVILEKELATKSPRENFEYLWRQCNEKYAYFGLKKVNWEDVKAKYAAKLYDGMSDDSLFKVLGGMLSELKDDHTNLASSFNMSNFGVQFLGQDNFDWRIVEENYLPKNYYQARPFAHDFIVKKNIGYIRLPNFTGGISHKNLDFILSRYKDSKGLIIDLRENGGGAISEVFTLLSRFVDSKTLIGYSRIKTGPGHEEFSEPVPIYVDPHAGVRYTGKVAVLIDRGTYSAGSLMALATKAMPNMFLVGDTTGGGLGLPNGGLLPNGWTYRFSVSQVLTLDKSPGYEGGVPADVPVLFNWNDRTKDAIIERALLELRQ